MADKPEQPEEEIKEEPKEEVQQQPEPSKPEEPEVTEEKSEEQEPEGEEEPAPAEAPAEEEPEEKPPSRRESLRIQQLLSKLKEPQAENKVEGGLDYSKSLDADPEVVAQLEADRKAVAQAEYQKGLDQAKSIQFHTRLEIDAPKVENKYPQLNKESDQFDPVIADALNNHYLHLVGYDQATDRVQNPNLRYADFIEAQFELAGALATEKITKTSQNIAKQAAQSGLRPDGSATKLNLNKAPEEMSDEELDAVLKTLPKNAR